MSATATSLASQSISAGTQKLSGLQRLGRNALLKRLRRLRHGEIIITEQGRALRFGAVSAACGLSAQIEVADPQFWADATLGGSVGAAESFVRGYWRCDALTTLVRIMVLNRELLNEMEGGLAFVTAPLRRVLHWVNRNWGNRNSKAGSRRNIAAHYDLGNDLFRLFLDDTMAYSCGIFERPDASMLEASQAKFAAACRKLQLGPSDHLLEIGTGWGGLAIHAARNYGCRVTTTTISRAQFDLARERIDAAGLSDRIELLLCDYRDLDGRYDKLVSIEMVEAVGHQFLETYLAKCSSLLKPRGAMLLQAITIQDQLYSSALRSVDFIQRYVFPGSFIPSITALVKATTRATDMKVARLDDIGPHYATTLRRWREAFFENIEQVRTLGYSEDFIRLWDYYLCYCEGGFIERQLGDVQMLLTKPGCRIDLYDQLSWQG
jgi:cyclopropane-fatty-acyl-phospholipid synthase